MCYRQFKRLYRQGRLLYAGVQTRTRARGNGSKLKEGRFRSDIRKKFFPMRVVRPWPRLPREAVAAPSLAVLRAGLDGALSNLV